MVVNVVREPRRGAQRFDHAGVHHVVRDGDVRREGGERADRLGARGVVGRVVLVRPRDPLHGHAAGRRAALAREHVHGRTARGERAQHDVEIAFHPARVAQTLCRDEDPHQRCAATARAYASSVASPVRRQVRAPSRRSSASPRSRGPRSSARSTAARMVAGSAGSA